MCLVSSLKAGPHRRLFAKVYTCDSVYAGIGHKFGLNLQEMTVKTGDHDVLVFLSCVIFGVVNKGFETNYVSAFNA